MKLTKRDRILIAVVAALAVLGGGWWLYIRPTSADADKARSEAQTEQARVASLQGQLAARLANPGPTPAVWAAGLRLAKATPGAARTPELIVQLSRSAARANVDLTAVTAGADREAGGYTGHLLTVTVKGTMFDVDDFLYRTSHMVARDRGGRLRITGRLIGYGKVDVQRDTDAGNGTVSAIVEVIAASSGGTSSTSTAGGAG